MSRDPGLTGTVATLELLEPGPREPPGGDRPTLSLLRAGGVPVGRLVCGAEGPEHDLPDASSPAHLTPAVAENVLRAGLAALLEQGAGPAPWRVADALGALADGTAATASPSGPSVAVVVCTRDRPGPLARALASIAPALGGGDELLVIDNASRDDATERLVRDRFPRARLVREARPGLDWARNRAIVESTAGVLAFCDDDCVMDPGTLPALRRLLARNPDVDAVTGLVEPMVLDTPAQQLLDRYLASNAHYRRRWILAPRAASVARAVGNVGQYGMGANLAVRRRVLDRVGVFDAALDAGTGTSAGGDLELLFRVLKSGALLAYEPRVHVRHEYRRELPEIEAHLEGWSRGFACAVERSRLAFPEERRAYGTVLARIAFLYHARRALTEPTLRRFALAELLAIPGARQRYAESRRAAAEIARTVASPAGDSAPDHAPAGARHRTKDRGAGTTVAMRADLGTLRTPIETGPGDHPVRLDLTLHGDPLGSVTVPACHGVVGLDRLRDAAIDALAPRLVGCSWAEAVAQAQRALAARAHSFAD